MGQKSRFQRYMSKRWRNAWSVPMWTHQLEEGFTFRCAKIRTLPVHSCFPNVITIELSLVLRSFPVGETICSLWMLEISGSEACFNWHNFNQCFYFLRLHYCNLKRLKHNLVQARESRGIKISGMENF